MSFGSEHVVNFNLYAFSEKCEMPRPESCESRCLIKGFWMATLLIMIKYVVHIWLTFL